MNQVSEPQQLLRLIRGISEDIGHLERHAERTSAAFAAQPPPPQDPATWLEQNGHAALAKLNIDNAATAKNTYTDTAPTASDDLTKGYNYFSKWIDTSTSAAYLCTNPAEGGATWTLIS